MQAFVLHEKHSFPRNGHNKTLKSDDSSLNHRLWGPFLPQGMFFVQNKCLEWIQNHENPLDRPLTCYLKKIFGGSFFPNPNPMVSE